MPGCSDSCNEDLEIATLRRSIVDQIALHAAFVLALVSSGTCTLACADAGVFTGYGQNLQQTSSKSVQLVTIDVTITPGRGRAIFDGGLGGLDVTDFDCRFQLKNLTATTQEVQVGFPVDSQFAENDNPASEQVALKETEDWVKSYSFIARDEKATYHVRFVHAHGTEGKRRYHSVFTWTMRFAPGETRNLSVSYHIPMTVAAGETRKDSTHYDLSSPLEQQLLNFALFENFGYITATGATWAGNVERAAFTVNNEPFEDYLNVRGVVESVPKELARGGDDSASRQGATLPVAHPRWFRLIAPPGWQKVAHGVQWVYSNYKPADPITVSYFTTQLPQLPQEVDPFCDALEHQLGFSTRGRRERDSSRSGTDEPKAPLDARVALLEQLKELLLATYGREPSDTVVKAHVMGQVWYEPKADFSMDSLTSVQRAVLESIDRRIETERAAS